MLSHVHMKGLMLLLTGMLAWGVMYAQNIGMLQTDSLHRELQLARQDTSRALIMTQLAEAYRGERNDSTLVYAQSALEIARRYKNPSLESKALSSICHYFWTRGNLPAALDAGLKALRIAREHRLRYDEAFAMIRVGNTYVAMNDYAEGLRYYRDTRKLVEHSPDSFFYAVTFWLSADTYRRMKQPDSALYMARLAYDTASSMQNPLILSQLPRVMGDIYASMGNDERAYQFYREGIEASIRRKDFSSVANGYLSLANLHQRQGRHDSAVSYALQAYELARSRERVGLELDAAGLLAKLYDSIDAGTSLNYLKIANSIRDSLYGADRLRAAQALSFKEKEQQYELTLAESGYRNNMRQLALLSGLGLLLLVSFGLYRNNRTKQKANIALQEQKHKVEEALVRLKAAQAQLVQSEKMASLGELTAGIAHEIQNPLNFVNNFAELNSELIDELKEYLGEGDVKSAAATAENLKENEMRIRQHGKRAEGIVRSMLLHSHAGSEQKEPRNINGLVEEYSRLAFHGFRGKYKDFKGELDISTDPRLGLTDVVTQDMGRVIVNLVNNALYTVYEKSRSAGPAYQPKVMVRTSLKDPGDGAGSHSRALSIEVADNGHGIPGNIRDKIFQPFFTTKPTGQGTGLGLSMSYDIVTKGHGGSLQVASTEGEGTIMTITLPTA